MWATRPGRRGRDPGAPGHPVRFPDFSPEVSSTAPRPGEDTEAVFGDVVDEQTTLDEWTAAGAFGGD